MFLLVYMININMRCIEIQIILGRQCRTDKININMRCIEIVKTNWNYGII